MVHNRCSPTHAKQMKQPIIIFLSQIITSIPVTGQQEASQCQSPNHVPACSKPSKVIWPGIPKAFRNQVSPPTYHCLEMSTLSEECPPCQNVPPRRVLLNPSHNDQFKNWLHLPLPKPNSRPELLTSNLGGWGCSEDLRQDTVQASGPLACPPTLQTADPH